VNSQEKMKTKIKNLICAILYHTGIFHLYLKYFFNTGKKFPAVIINYHSFVQNFDHVMETHPTVTHLIAEFDQELDFLKKYFDVVNLDKIADTLHEGKKFNRPTVAITVDDGYKDNYDLLFPIVKKHQVPVTIFLSTGVIGTNQQLWFSSLSNAILNTKRESLFLNGIFTGKTFPLKNLEEKRASYNSIVQKLKTVETTKRDDYLHLIDEKLETKTSPHRLMLNWDEIREMHNNGVYFGAHTITHPILSKVSNPDGIKEIDESRKKIEQELSIRVRHFAFPNGRPQDFTDELRTFCRHSGFDSVSSCDFGNNSTATDVWNLKRVGSEVPISLFAFNMIRAFRH
jgi:peptidoglycan/xylan/chitin deacetylase (PgdA/CDA1 family)